MRILLHVMKGALTVLMLPVLLTLMIISGLVRLITKIYGVACGIIFLLLGLCAVLMICYQMWKQLLMLGVVFGLLYLLGFAGEVVYVLLEVIRMNLQSFIFY